MRHICLPAVAALSLSILLGAGHLRDDAARKECGDVTVAYLKHVAAGRPLQAVDECFDAPPSPARSSATTSRNSTPARSRT